MNIYPISGKLKPEIILTNNSVNLNIQPIKVITAINIEHNFKYILLSHQIYMNGHKLHDLYHK